MTAWSISPMLLGQRWVGNSFTHHIVHIRKRVYTVRKRGISELHVNTILNSLHDVDIRRRQQDVLQEARH